MASTAEDEKINGKFVLITAFAVLFSSVLHEYAHWLAGTRLGYSMAMTLNKAYPLAGKYDSDKDYQLVTAAGPLLTLIEALLVFIIMKRKNARSLYPFLVTAFYMRLLATVLSLRKPNDEARISSYIGIGKFTLPLFVTAFLFLLVYTTSQHYGFTKKLNAITVGLIICFYSIIILADQAFHIQLK